MRATRRQIKLVQNIIDKTHHWWWISDKEFAAMQALINEAEDHRLAKAAVVAPAKVVKATAAPVAKTVHRVRCHRCR